MNKKQRDRLVWFAAVTIIGGAVLSLSHVCVGWFLITLGMIYLSGLTSAGRKWVADNPDYLQWGLIGGILLVVVLVVMVSV